MNENSWHGIHIVFCFMSVSALMSWSLHDEPPLNLLVAALRDGRPRSEQHSFILEPTASALFSHNPDILDQ